MAAKEISVKKYVVRLSGEERERLETLIRKGKTPARRVLKARILLKADVYPCFVKPGGSSVMPPPVNRMLRGP